MIKYILIFNILLCSIFTNANEYSPSGKVWQYEGSEVPSMKMKFHEDGSLEFQKGFLRLNFAMWKYDSNTKELTITLPKSKPQDFYVFSVDEGKKSNFYENPKKIVKNKKMIVYNFPSKINFLGFIFEEAKSSQINNQSIDLKNIIK